jgi:riboflavin kinase / FMN adenylyltransferase
MVTEGNKLGRTIGYPTANLQIQGEDKLVPANGVYAVTIALKNSSSENNIYKGMMNIGVRPTIDGTKKVIEVNIFDFNKDIYGQSMRVYLRKYLRPEQKFDGLEALKAQLARDKERVEKVLSNKL